MTVDDLRKPSVPIVIAGATGFIGQELIRSLSGHYTIHALTRHVTTKHTTKDFQHDLVWIKADFFSVDSLAQALKGAHTAIYLIHSMMPTARLDQSSFENSDLWLADSFARAARQAGIKRIIYLGGLLPDVAESQLSMHLRSRKEVEDVLGSSGIPVITLRAGLVLGANGSSFQMLYLLVKRLRWMLCPRWAHTSMQPISVEDIVELIKFCIENNAIQSGAYDVGGPDIVTYRALMLKCAELLGLKRTLVRAPLFSPGLSTLWVCLITGASRNLVAPLVRSMTHSMVVRRNQLLELFGKPLQTIDQALRTCLKKATPQLRAATRERRQARHQEHDVRSIQRLHIPSGATADQLANAYFSWTSSKMRPWIQVKRPNADEVQFCFQLFSLNIDLIKLHRNEINPHSTSLASFNIVGGALVRSTKNIYGTFEFRTSLEPSYGLVGLHGFHPSLPWGLYKFSQAIVHKIIMNLFSKWLAQQQNLSKAPTGISS